MASIKDIHFSPTSRMPVRHPVSDAVMLMEDGREQYIELAGVDSPQFKRVVAAQQDRNARRRRPGGAKEAEQGAIDTLVGCTSGWLLEAEDGTELPFSEDAARALYTGLRWLRDQCDVWAGDRANYLGESESA